MSRRIIATLFRSSHRYGDTGTDSSGPGRLSINQPARHPVEEDLTYRAKSALALIAPALRRRADVPASIEPAMSPPGATAVRRRERGSPGGVSSPHTAVIGKVCVARD